MPEPQVLMYTKSWCPHCQRARTLLARKGARIAEVDIEMLPEKHREMIARSGRRTVPQIFIGDQHVGGADDLQALEAAGKLEPLLATG